MMAQFPFSTLEEKWTGYTHAFVIGGGTSLIGFDFSVLKGKGITIGANKAAFHANADVLVTVDQNFAKQNRDEIAEFVERGKMAVLIMPVNGSYHTPIEGAIYVIRDRQFLNDDRTRIHAIHSGMGAIGAAAHLGAKKISLLGMDMKASNQGRIHFHEGYASQNHNADRFMRKWASGGSFEKAKEHLDAKGIEVVNYVGPNGSEIEVFEKRSLDELKMKDDCNEPV